MSQSAGFTRQERDTLEAIAHHVACYNQREITSIECERLKILIDGGVAAFGQIIIGMGFGRRRGGVA